MEYLNYYCSPIGVLKITTDNEKVLEINFVEKRGINNRKNKIFLQIEKQLTEYFLGKRKEFSVPFVLNGTEFQKKVWLEIKKISYGETKTYKEIGKSIENQKAVRAIGNASNKNKLPIIIPCHRVIGSNGKLTGYLGGLLKKSYLLKIEGEKMFKFIYYPKCSTCIKAKKWLIENKIDFQERDIVKDKLKKEELEEIIKMSELPIKKFFNTSGVLYRELNLKTKVLEGNFDELLEILSSDGMLVKRPLVVGNNIVKIGFKEKEWEELKNS